MSTATAPSIPPPVAIPSKPTSSLSGSGTAILVGFVAFILGCAAAGIAVGLSVHFSERAKDTKSTTTQIVTLPFWPPFFEAPSVVAWSYDAGAEDGPAHWGEIRNLTDGVIAYPACDGQAQSPVDLPTFPVNVARLPLARVVSNYTVNQDFQIDARPSGHPGFQVKAASASTQPGYLMVDGEKYELLQFHFHAPSEHTVNGVHFPLEIHIVHRKVGASGNDNLAVFGILYNETDDGMHNEVFDKLWFEIHHAVPHVSGVSVTNILGQMGPSYYRYNGSLTTPPCSETVKWHVAQSTVGVNVMQMKLYIYALNGIENYRNTNDLNGRSIASFKGI